MIKLFCTFLTAFAVITMASASVASTSPTREPSVSKSWIAVADGDGDEKADRAPDTTARTAQERQQARLDLMFGRLENSTDKRRADRIARHIMRRLSQSGSDTVDVLMQRAGQAMQTENYGTALDLLDGVVRLKPDFAEGWNRRATVHFMKGDYGSSLSDIREVLRREPRHWGALAGLSMILVAVERKEEAVEVMDRALAIHPHLEEMRERRDSLVKELDGADI